MQAIFWLIDSVLGIYMLFLFVWVIISWLVAFNVINTYNRFVAMVMDFLYRLTEPGLRPIRRFMPNLGGIDLSPLVLLLAVQFLRVLLRTSIAPMFGVHVY